MIGAAGRVFFAGETPAVELARMRIVEFLEAIPGRDQ